MNILARYTLKSLWLNRRRTAVTILGVILASALICGVVILGNSFQQMMINRAIGDYGNFHAELLNVPFEKVKYITQNAEVKSAMLSTPLSSAVFGSLDPENPFLFLSSYDQAMLENQAIFLTAGRLPEKAGELLISETLALAEGQNLKPGSQITLTLGQRSIPGEGLPSSQAFELVEGEVFDAGETKPYTVVGVMEPSFGERISNYPGYGAIELLETDRLNPGDLVNVAVLVDHPYSIYSTLPRIIEAAGLPSGPIDPADVSGALLINYNDNLLQWMGVKDNQYFMVFFLSILGIMIGLVGLGSGLVIYNAFSISVSERKKQFGMFASSGATASQIRQSVLLEALVTGAAGIPLGILGGILGVWVTLGFTGSIINELFDVSGGMPLVISPLVVALTILFASLSILISAWIPAERASKISPIDAIRQSEDIRREDRAGEKRGRKTALLVRKLLGFEAELALKSLRRDRKKYRTTVISLMISIILFIAFNSLMEYSNISAEINNESTNYDLQLYLADKSEDIDRFVAHVSGLPAVQGFSQKRCLDGTTLVSREQITDQAYQAISEFSSLVFVDGKTSLQAIVCAFGPVEFNRMVHQLGKDPDSFAGSEDYQAVLVNQNQMRYDKLFSYELLALQPGEQMEVTLYSDRENGQPASFGFQVGALADSYPVGASPESTGVLLVVADEVYDRLAASLDLSYEDPGTLYFQSADPETLTTEVIESYKTMTGFAPAYYSMAEYNRQNNLIEFMVRLFFYGFLALITLVGVTNIVNTIDTNIHLRRREFAMLRSVGLAPNGFARILWFEGLFYGLTALAFGLPIGVALSVLLYYRFSLVSSFAFSLPWAQIAACAAGVLLIVFATMLLAGRRIQDDNIVSAIKADNL